MVTETFAPDFQRDFLRDFRQLTRAERRALVPHLRVEAEGQAYLAELEGFLTPFALSLCFYQILRYWQAPVARGRTVPLTKHECEQEVLHALRLYARVPRESAHG